MLGAVVPIRQGCAHPVSFACERAYSITSRVGVDGISPGLSPERTGKIVVDARRRDSNPGTRIMIPLRFGSTEPNVR